MKLLKKKEKRSRTRLKKMKWGRWGMPQTNYKIVGTTNLERGVVS